MVQFVVDVVVDTSDTEKGAKRVKGKLKEVETSAGRLEKQLKRAFTGAAILATAVAVGRLADAFTNAQNKLRNLVSDEEQLVDVTEKLFDVANRTRQSFESTATVYSRIGVAAKDLGLEQETLLQFTESLNQAVALSGASATEAEAGLIQLSQGLAAGALRGEELNSVLEQLPAVADVIAQSLGVTRGQLRKLGAEGKISAEVVLRAFAEAREELDERFAKTVPTIGQSFTVLKNNALEAVGAIDQATGASSAFASVLILVSENLDVVAAGVIVLAVAAIPALITALLALTGQATITAAVLSTAALFNPIILGAAAAGAATILLIDQFIDVEEAARDTKAELDKFLLADDPLLLLTIQNVEKTLASVQRAAARGLFPDDEAAERVQVLEDRLRELRGEQESLNDGTGRTLTQIRAQSQALEDLEKAVTDTAAATVAEAQASLLTNRELERRTKLLKEVARIEEEQRKPLSDEQKEGLALAFDQAQALQEQQAALEAIRGPQEQLAARIAALNALEEKELITTDELTAALAELAKSAEDIDLSGIAEGAGGDAAGALATIREQIAAAREKATLDAQRVQLLAEIQGPLQGLLDKEQLLLELEREGAISKGQLTAALAANRMEIELLNPEVARLAALTEELLGPTEDLIQREQDLQTLIAQGGPNAAAFAEELKNVQEALNPLTEEEQRRADILKSIEGPEQERIARLTELDALLKSNTINQTQYREELEKMGVATETSNTALGGFKVGLANARAEMTDVQGAAQELTENGFAAAEDALVSFVRTGEADFSAFVEGLLDDIARLLVKQALLAAFGGGGEAGAGFIGSLFAAEGGRMPGNADVIVGEEGPERIRTPAGGASITPAGETAAMMRNAAAAPVVNVGGPTINNMVVDDPEAIPAGIESKEGTQAILNVVRKERRTIRGTIG